MRTSPFFVLSLSLLCISHPVAFGQSGSDAKLSRPVDRALPSGVEVMEGGTTLRVTALREDVLRVRMWKGGAAPEDASWAVLPAARTATVKVKVEADGFRTSELRVAVDGELRLTVSDLAGNVLQQDAEPVAWRGTDFRVYKAMSSADHFFGLGDKPGPLDRAGEAFVMWNTDHFGWQESTDPIYKDIPVLS